MPAVTTDEPCLKAHVLELLARRHQRLTLPDLLRAVQERFPESQHRDIRRLLKAMVCDGLLAYTSHFNTSHLELGQGRPLKVSQRITLCSPGGPTQSAVASVQITPGAAFGVGDHPTTRLALQALDRAVAHLQINSALQGSRALDIGTGNGVLAIAAVLLGLSSALAIDIDPLALHEARQNLDINAVADRISLTDASLDTLATGSFILIVANLRQPTLKEILPSISRVSCLQALWVFSGFRPAEQTSLLEATGGMNRRKYWETTSHDWAAVLLGP